MLVVMVRIPVGSARDAERLEERFRNRAGLVDNQPGFLGFELLKGNSEYISVTRWATREDLDRWTQSQAHADAHGRVPHPTGGGHPPQTSPLGEPGDKGAHGQEAGGGAALSGTTQIYEVLIPEAKQ